MFDDTFGSHCVCFFDFLSKYTFAWRTCWLLAKCCEIYMNMHSTEQYLMRCGQCYVFQISHLYSLNYGPVNAQRTSSSLHIAKHILSTIASSQIEALRLLNLWVRSMGWGRAASMPVSRVCIWIVFFVARILRVLVRDDASYLLVCCYALDVTENGKELSLVYESKRRTWKLNSTGNLILRTVHFLLQNNCPEICCIASRAGEP